MTSVLRMIHIVAPTLISILGDWCHIFVPTYISLPLSVLVRKLFVTVSTLHANLGLVFGARRPVGAGYVSLLLRLSFDLLFLFRTFEFGPLEGDAAHHGSCEFLVRHVAESIGYFFLCHGYVGVRD